MSDIDGDNYLDLDEFCLAMFLIQNKLAGEELPSILSPSLLPKKGKHTTVYRNQYSSAFYVHSHHNAFDRLQGEEREQHSEERYVHYHSRKAIKSYFETFFQSGTCVVHPLSVLVCLG